MSDIVERLRAEATDNRRYEVNGTLAVEAADLITALRAENERLRAALDMIDSISVHNGGDIHGVHPSFWEVAFKQAQDVARAALEEKS